jgi:hypothetical protein
MSFGALNFELARHVPDMMQHIAKYLVDMSARSPICQRPKGGVDTDMSAEVDMSSITLIG